LRHHDLKVISGFARHIAAGATLPDFCFEPSGDTKIGQRIERRVGHKVDTATMTTVTTVRTTSGYVFFATEAQGTVAAIARLYTDCRFVDEFHCLTLIRKTPQQRGFSNDW
jgi:hypothetical protein